MINFIFKNNELITEENLDKIGFTISQNNKHAYDIQAECDSFQVLKVLGNSTDFIVSFFTYYEDVEFDGFKYMWQIEMLYFSLKHKQLIETEKI